MLSSTSDRLQYMLIAIPVVWNLHIHYRHLGTLEADSRYSSTAVILIEQSQVCAKYKSNRL